MTKRNLIISITAVCLVAFILRTVYPFKVVFGMGFVNFIETDAWYKMGIAQNIANMPFLDGLNYTILNNQLFGWIIAMLSHFGNIEVIGAWLPPVVAIGAIVAVFFIGKELFNDYIGLCAAIFMAIIPSEFLSRSMLGFTDHHVMEALLMALVVLFLIKAVKSNKPFSKWVILAGVSILLFALNWKSGIYVMGLVIAVLILVLLFVRGNNWKPNTLAVIGIGLLGLAFYLPIGGYHQLLFFIPGQEAQQAALRTGEIVQTVIAPMSQRTTSELMPLFAPYGSFNPSVIITNLHIFAVAFLAGIPLIWKYRHDKAVLLFAVWTLVMLIITLNERRFMYYLTIGIAVITALLVYELSLKLKGDRYFNVMILTIPFIVLSLPLAKSVGENQPIAMTADWHSSLVWLKDQPDKGNVTAWTDFGHWIKYVSGKTPNYLPGPGGVEVSQLFLTTDPDKGRDLLDTLNTGYLIIDRYTLEKRTNTLSHYAGFPVAEGSLAYEMGYKNIVPDYLKLEYESQTIKIYSYSGG